MGKSRNYRVEPNSHFWTDLNQLLEHLKYKDLSMEYLKIGIKNTLEHGYNLKQKRKNKKNEI